MRTNPIACGLARLLDLHTVCLCPVFVFAVLPNKESARLASAGKRPSIGVLCKPIAAALLARTGRPRQVCVSPRDEYSQIEMHRPRSHGLSLPN